MNRTNRRPIGAKRLVDRVAYQPGLDGIRGLAAMAVFAVHLEQNSVIDGNLGPISLQQLCINGRTGVAMFFLLTGYFLAGPLWSRPVEQRLSRTLGDFWKRRAAKLIPLYWSVLFALTVFNRSWSTSDDRWDLLIHAAFLQNAWPSTLYSISEPMWAIAVIGQYYAFFWIVTALLGYLGCLTNRSLYLVFGGLMSIGWGLNYVVAGTGTFDNPDNMLVWQHSLPIHLPIFALGAVLAAFGKRSAPSPLADRSWDVAAAAAAIGLIFVLGTSLVDALQWRGGRYGYPIVPGMLAIILYAATCGGWAQRILSWRPLVALGLISYGVYLLHLPILRLTKRVLATNGMDHPSAMLLAVVSLGATCVVAWIITICIEVPLRRHVVGSKPIRVDASS